MSISGQAHEIIIYAMRQRTRADNLTICDFKNKIDVSFSCVCPVIDNEFNHKGPGKREHIVADTLLPTQMFPRLPAHATFVADTKNVSDFVQKHFVSATNVSQFAQPKKHHEQPCVRNNVSSFASTLTLSK